MIFWEGRGRERRIVLRHKLKKEREILMLFIVER